MKPESNREADLKNKTSWPSAGDIGLFYVVGNGPSLTAAMLDALPDGRWLGMNSAYKHWNQTGKYPKYYACLDPVVVKSQHAGIGALLASSPIEKYFLHDAVLEVAPEMAGDSRVTFLSKFLSDPDLTVRVSTASREKQTTGSLSVRFAIEQGETDLLLLGTDCNYVDVIEEAERGIENELVIGKQVGKNPNYFFDGYQGVGDRYQIPSPRVHSGNLHLQSFVCLQNDLLASGRAVAVQVGSVKSLLHKYGVFPFRSFWRTVGRRTLQCVAVPLTHGEIDALIENLAKWLDPRLKPSLAQRKRGTCLHLFFDFAEDAKVIERINQFLLGHPEIHSYFDDVRLTFLDFPDDVNYYVRPGSDARRFCSKSGPNLFFLSVMSHCRIYEFTMQMESDCMPMRAGWLDAADHQLHGDTEEAWIIGPGYLGPTQLHSSYQMHINGNAIYQTGSPEFQDFLANDFVTILKDLVNLGINDLAYDTTLSIAYANLGMLSVSCRQALLRALPRFRHSSLVLNAGGTSENTRGYAVDVRTLLKAHPDSFIVHGRLAADAVRQDLAALDRYFNSNPEVFSKELPFVSLWTGHGGFDVLDYRGFGSAVIAGRPDDAQSNVVMHFSRLDDSDLRGRKLVFSARVHGDSERIASVKIVLRGEDESFYRCDGTSSIVAGESAADLTVATSDLSAAGHMSLVGVEITLPRDADGSALKLELSGISCVEVGQAGVERRPATVAPPAAEIRQIVGSWREFLQAGETGQARSGDTVGLGLILKNFVSAEFFLDYTGVVGSVIEMRLRRNSGLSRGALPNDDMPTAQLVFGGFPMLGAAAFRLSVKGLGASGSLLCRLCRDGTTPWEYADIPVLDERPRTFKNFFKLPHDGFRLEIRKAQGLALQQQFAIRLELVPRANLEGDRTSAATGFDLRTVNRPENADAFPRLLMIDSTPIGSESATGQIKLMFLEHWPEDRLMQIYEGDGGLRVKSSPGSAQEDANPADMELLRVCRAFSPDVICFRPIDSLRLLAFAERAVGDLARPLVVHVMDDWPERLKEKDPRSFAVLDPVLRRLLKRAATRLSIGSAMSNAYAERYGQHFLPLANGVDVDSVPAKDWKSRTAISKERPFLIRYMGALADDMTFSSVVDVAKAVAVVQARLPVRFEIFTVGWCLESAREAVGNLPGVEVNPLVDASEYPGHLAEADALLIAYNFDPESIRYVGLSMSNKMPECLASGVPVLAYGPREIATIAYLDQANCARVVMERSHELLCQAIEHLATHLDQCRELGKDGREVARQRHDRKAAQKRFLAIHQDAAKQSGVADRPLVGPYRRSQAARYDETDCVAQLFSGSRGDLTMIDVGAHHGSALLPFLNMGWRIFAFEPDEKNRRILIEHLATRENAALVKLDARAVSNESRSGLTLYRSDESTGISGLSSFHPSHRPEQIVDVVTLKEALADEALTGIDFLKIDTEGYDLPVLQGFPWERFKPTVIECEFEDSKTLPLGYSFHDLAGYLVAMGYTVYVSEWHPVLRYGIPHDWNRLMRYPCELADSGAWGNLLAFRDPIDERPLIAAVQLLLKTNEEPVKEPLAPVSAHQGSRDTAAHLPVANSTEHALPEKASPDDRMVLRMDAAELGNGWHAAEFGEWGSLRWTGPDARATMVLPVRRDRALLIAVAYHTPLIEEQLAKIRLEVDGVTLPHSVRTDTNPKFILASVPARSAASENATELALVLPRTVSPSSLPGGSSDQRLLGIAVLSVSIMPMDPALSIKLPASGLELFRRFAASPGQSRIAPDFPFSHFDGLAYMEANPDAAESVIAGSTHSALEHYYRYGRKDARRIALAVTRVPNEGRLAELFDGLAYLTTNPDVTGAIRSGAIASALDHYVNYGRKEGRKLCTRFDGHGLRGTEADLLRLEALRDAKADMDSLKAELKIEFSARSSQLENQLAKIHSAVPGFARASDLEVLRIALGEAAQHSRKGFERLEAQLVALTSARDAREQAFLARIDALRAGIDASRTLADLAETRAASAPHRLRRD